uniref:Diacylglycerol kinase n=1 Tax=Macrostomum lignano TaxID=282301 RepID=A0A1I8FGS0_9PLAT
EPSDFPGPQQPRLSRAHLPRSLPARVENWAGPPRSSLAVEARAIFVLLMPAGPPPLWPPPSQPVESTVSGSNSDQQQASRSARRDGLTEPLLPGAAAGLRRLGGRHAADRRRRTAVPPLASPRTTAASALALIGGPASSSFGGSSSLEGVDKELVRCLSELESGAPEEKLEFVFRLFDTDGNGYLDTSEVDAIISQMMKVTEYLGWDTTELLPILKSMMTDLDFDADGTVSLDEWKRGGLTTIPLLVLLGLDTTVKDDGSHVWRLKHFAKGRHCNICMKQLVGLGKQGLGCVFLQCVSAAPRLASCIFTYTKSKRPAPGAQQSMQHHWTEGNCVEKCAKCRKSIKSGITVPLVQGQPAQQVRGAVDQRVRPVAPSASTCCPPRRDLPRRTGPRQQAGGGSQREPPQQPVRRSSSFQIVPPSGCVPLLVFINPKSGGKQGVRILHKMQYLLNPPPGVRPGEGRRAGAAAVPHPGVRRDGTAGWLLEAMDKFDWGDNRPPVAVLPLGTGNDLARCLRWGGGYENESLEKILHRISQGSPARDEIPATIINNYFSIGVDAAIAHRPAAV